MRLEVGTDVVERLFVIGGRLLSQRAWTWSERDWVWSLRFLAWRYLLQTIAEEWTTTEECFELPAGADALRLRREAVRLLGRRGAVCVRRLPGGGFALMELGRRLLADTREALGLWLAHNTPGVLTEARG